MQSGLHVCVLFFQAQVMVLHVGKAIQVIKVSIVSWVCAGANSTVKGNFKLTKPFHFSDHF